MDTIIQTIAKEVQKRYYIGALDKTTPSAIIGVAREMYPDYDWENSDLIFQIMMKI